MTAPTLIGEQQACLEQTLRALEVERECLKSGQVDGSSLAETADRKQSWLSRLEQLETQRREAQLAAGYGEGRHGAQRFAESLDAGSQWAQIVLLAQQVQQINRLNGFIISQRLEHNQRAIDFLNQAIGGSVYGPNGQSRHGGFGGISSKA